MYLWQCIFTWETKTWYKYVFEDTSEAALKLCLDKNREKKFDAVKVVLLADCKEVLNRHIVVSF